MRRVSPPALAEEASDTTAASSDGDTLAAPSALSTVPPAQGKPAEVVPLTTSSKLDLIIQREEMRRHLDRGRSYVWPPFAEPQAQTSYPGVTSIIKGAVPAPQLTRWAAKAVAEHAVENVALLHELAQSDEQGAIDWLKREPFKQRDAAAERGSAVHTICELIASGETDVAHDLIDQSSLDVQVIAHHLLSFFEMFDPEVIDAESIVYGEVKNYAGTYDLICRLSDTRVTARLPWGDRPFMLDLKTGKGVYPEAAVQMSAYANADFRADLNTGQAIDPIEVAGAAVLHCTADKWSLIPVEYSADTWDAFCALRVSYDCLPLPKQWVGMPVARSAKTVSEA